MSIFGKLAFWKKGDDFGLDSSDLGLGGNNPSGLDGGTNSFDTNSFGPDSNKSTLGMNDNNGFNSPNSGTDNMGNFGMDNSQPQGFSSGQQQNPTEEIYQAASPFPASTGSPSASGSHHTDIMSKDIEVISSKIDALRASLDSVNQRLINVEHMLREDKESKYKW